MNPPLTAPHRRVRKALRKFSAKAAAGCSVHGCPQPTQGTAPPPPPAPEVPDKPCNLVSLLLTEPKAQPNGEDGVRKADLRAGIDLQRRTDPVRMPIGSAFQITACSKRQEPRQVQAVFHQEAWCGDPVHQKILVTGPEGHEWHPGTSVTLPFHRRPSPIDSLPPGSWGLLNQLFRPDNDPLIYAVLSRTCGLPPVAAARPLSAGLAMVQVFPADQYEFELVLPPPSAREKDLVDLKSKAHRSRSEAEAEEYPAAGLKKKEFVSSYADKVTCKVTHTDGDYTRTIQIDEIVKLATAIVDAQYRVQKIDEWFDSFSSNRPGASLSIKLSFLGGTVKADWGMKEYTDDRVFFAWNAALNLDVVKGEIKFTAGIKCGGLADLYVELGGEGALGLSLKASKQKPDDEAGATDVTLKPNGEFTLSGSLKSSLMWMVKGEVGLECAFKLDVEKFSFLKDGNFMKGPLKLKREPVYRVVSYSNRLFGFGGTDKRKKKTLVKADDYLIHEFA